MAPAANNSPPKPNQHLEGGDYQVVAWDLDTTGRRLIDEICQIGGFYVLANPPKEDKKDSGKESSDSECMQTFSQYVMPYKNPNPGARRSFGIKVVSVGRYRMLKDLDTGKILKTKSEVSALQDFIDWLKEAKSLSGKDGILLACHEPNRKVLVPLLLEALYKYNLLDQFNETVCGFVNGVSVVEKLGGDFSITSHSLRSLCKTVLSDTNPTTASASDRSRVLIQIISKVCIPKNVSSTDSVSTLEGKEDTKSTSENSIQGSIRPIDASSIFHVATTVQQEEEELRNLKGMLDTQGTLRPIFESHLRQKRSVRERAMQLRKIVAESGLDYDKVATIFTSAIPTSDEQNNQDIENDEKEKIEKEENEKVKANLKEKIPDANEQDLEELIVLFQSHFRSSSTSSTNNVATNPNEENKSSSHNLNGSNPVANKNATSNNSTSLGNKNPQQKTYKKKPQENIASRTSANVTTKKSHSPKVSASAGTATNSATVEK